MFEAISIFLKKWNFRFDKRICLYHSTIERIGLTWGAALQFGTSDIDTYYLLLDFPQYVLRMILTLSTEHVQYVSIQNV